VGETFFCRETFRAREWFAVGTAGRGMKNKKTQLCAMGGQKTGTRVKKKSLGGGWLGEDSRAVGVGFLEIHQRKVKSKKGGVEEGGKW